jgi:hypothetical protein
MADNVAYLPSRAAGPGARAMAAAAPSMQGQARAEPAFPYEVGDLVGMFEDAEDATRASRKIAERCRDYYDNKQLTREEVAELGKRGQPEIIRNVIKGKVNFYLGWEAKNRSDPRAYPNEDDDEDVASAVTDMLRFQERKSSLDQKFSDCWEMMLIEGYNGAIEVLGPSKKDPRVIEVKRWKWDRTFYDPASAEHDFSDARYLGGVVWMDRAEAIAKWPQAKGLVETTITNEMGTSTTYDDKPRQSAWVTQGKRVRIRVVQIYCKAGEQWFWAIFTKGGIIDKGAVAFVDEQGNSVCPMLMQALYVDRDNNRYGEVYEFLWTQDEINKRASKALHLANSSLTIGEEGTGLDIDAIKAQKARPDGHISLPPGTKDKFEFVEHDRKIEQNREMMMDAKLHVEQRGPNASLLGTQNNAPSGRAIRANQEGGLIEGTRPRDRFLALKSRTYQAIWLRCRQFLVDPISITVPDDEDGVRKVGFNTPVRSVDKLVAGARNEGMDEDEIQGKLGALTQQLAQTAAQAGHPDPMGAANEQLNQVTVHNRLAEMDVDLIIEPATESINMQQELFEVLAQRQDVPLDLLIEFSPISARQKKRYRDKLAEAQQATAQAQQQQAAVVVENAKSKIEQNRASAMKDLAQADHIQAQTRKTHVDTAHQVEVGPYGPPQMPGADATQPLGPGAA